MIKKENESKLEPKFGKNENKLKPKFDEINENEQVLKQKIEPKESDVSIKVSAEIHRIVKLNSLLDDTTMKDYLEKLVLEDNSKRE